MTDISTMKYLGKRSCRLQASPSELLSDPPVAKAAILRNVASGTALTRPALTKTAGIARTTLSILIEELMDGGILVSGQTPKENGRGRPAEAFEIPDEFGVILAVSVSTNSAELAIMTLSQTCLAYAETPIDILSGPEKVLQDLISKLKALLVNLANPRVLLVSVGLPAPIDQRTGSPNRPPIMPGWDRFPVSAYMSGHFDCSTLVDNDVNLMALAESRLNPPPPLPLLYIMIGTGVGSGMVFENGTVHRGAHGAAGDLGHIRVTSNTDIVCNCGNTGCLEAVASEMAMAKEWNLLSENSPGDIAAFERAIKAGDPLATRILRNAAAIVGEAVATMVHLYNPAQISLGGPLTSISDDLLSGVRSVVYRRALPLATGDLILSHSKLGKEAAIVGASVAGVDAVLMPEFGRVAGVW